MKYLDNEGNIYTTMKYQNKEGISLNYTGNDIHTRLVKEVITEACEIIYGGGTTEGYNFYFSLAGSRFTWSTNGDNEYLSTIVPPRSKIQQRIIYQR